MPSIFATYLFSITIQQAKPYLSQHIRDTTNVYGSTTLRGPHVETVQCSAMQSGRLTLHGTSVSYIRPSVPVTEGATTNMHAFQYMCESTQIHNGVASAARETEEWYSVLYVTDSNLLADSANTLHRHARKFHGDCWPSDKPFRRRGGNSVSTYIGTNNIPYAIASP
jgi:hypothetical protein